MLSVVVPTLNAGASLERCLEAVGHGSALVGEIIVSDGGSVDDTVDIATRYAARVLVGRRGRGGQLSAGAACARGDWLLFLHADTVLAPEWLSEVARFMGDPESQSRAAAFSFALNDTARGARRVERIVAWRCRVLGLPYGDQGLLIQRAFYEKVGGFRPLPLMEDVDLVRRIGRSRVVILDQQAKTSAQRYRRGGYWGRPARNLLCLGLYFLGVPPRFLVRLYG